jgi:hypothetical protein
LNSAACHAAQNDNSFVAVSGEVPDMTHRKVALLLAIAVLAVSLFFLPSPIQAQAVYGSILGTVTDPNGAAVPNAKVTVTNVRKGTTDVTTTNGDGNYSVTHLIPNVYTVKVEAPNFKSTQTDNVVVNADASSRVDLPLQLGQVSESVEVTVEAPQLKTDRADVSTTFDTKQVEDLPILNRNFTNFLLLTPGAQILSGWSHAATENPQGSKQTFVNGQHFSGTGYELDGTDNQDPILGIIVINPNLDAVTEAKITTADYDAEFGKAIAGIVAAQTKSGSNGFHGSIFEYRRTDALQAKDPFQKPDAVTGKVVPPDKWNQFGASIGGPIKKDKVFFFGDYQGTREIFGQSQQVTVPTAQVRASCLAATGFCDLSQYLGSGTQGQVFDPATGNPDGSGRTPFAGNLIPVNRLSPQALKILAALPAPSSGGTTNNFSAVGSGPYNQDGFDGRIDYAVRSNMNLFGRYSMQKFNLSGEGVFGALGGPGFGPQGLAGSSNASNHSIATGFTYTFSPTLLTDFRFGFFRYHVNAQKFDNGTTPASDFGIPGLNTSPLTSGLPGFFIDTSNDNDQGLKIGEALNIGRCNCPLTEAEHQQQYVTNWTKVRGNHQFKFGADIRFANNLRVPSDANRAGQLNFRQNGTSLAGAGGLGLATFLLGQVSDMSRYVNNPNALGPHENQKRYFFYGQDIFRVTQKLTVNYGLRWEYYGPETVDCKGCGGFGHISNGQVLVAGFGDVNQAGNVDPTYNAFAPRFGIAYQATEKTVVRMGYGRSFDIGVFGSIFGHTVTQNLPVLVNQSVTAQNNGNPNATNDVVGAFNLATGPPAAVFPTIPASGILPLQGVCTPPAPTVANPNPTCNGNFNSKTRPDKMRLPTLDAWNLTIQRQITPTMSGEIAYVGNKGTHVFIGNGPSYNLNTPSIVGFAQGVPQAQRRPFFKNGVPAFTYADFPGVICCTGDIDWRGDEASSNYHALQLRLDKRFGHGLTFQSHYTWSKAYGYGFGDNADYYAIDPKVVYGRVDFNRDHVFLVNGTYELPFGKGKAFANSGHGVVEALAGGWQISTIASVFSGLPFTPSYNLCGKDRDSGPCRPNIVGGSFDMGLGTFDPVSKTITFFTPVAPLAANGDTAGIFQRPAIGTFGTGGANSLTGPGNWTLDGGLIKRIPIGERVRGQFRVDVFNLFNHMVPGFSQNQGNRCIDCSKLVNGVVQPTGNAGQATSLEFGRTMRNAQFALRFEF